MLPVELIFAYFCFNTQPPEGGWDCGQLQVWRFQVSTHSRPKAAGSSHFRFAIRDQRFNTQPPEGGWQIFYIAGGGVVLFQHTAARRRLAPLLEISPDILHAVSTHSRPKAAGFQLQNLAHSAPLFQHTAARRRLDTLCRDCGQPAAVSTHSRPKAAGPPRQVPIPQSAFQHTAARRRLVWLPKPMTAPFCFNTQPPEGGW